MNQGKFHPGETETEGSPGMLAACVAHEINNSLTAVAGNLEIAMEKLSDLGNEAAAMAPSAGGGVSRPDTAIPHLLTGLSTVAQALRDVQEAAEQARVIVRDLKALSGSAEVEQRGPVAIERVLDASIRLASREFRHRARLVKDFREVPPVWGNEGRLGQVFLNLIVNAAQAIPIGGAAVNEIRISTWLGADDRVVTEVRDSGAGIPAESQARIFDPFFSTKPAGLGTGLGLTICRRIVTALGGDIAVDSEPGQGTAVRVSLPRARSASAEATDASTVQADSRRGRVLVVDDDTQVRTLIGRILREHEVVTVASAVQALELIRGGERFDAVLCDLMMPRMTGMELHAELSRTLPTQAAGMVFMTGGAFDEEASEFLETVANASILKPFCHTALRQLIQDHLR